MAVVNRFNVNNKQVTLNMSANDVSYNDSFQYDENTVGNKFSELKSDMDVFESTIRDQVENYKPIVINGNVTNAADEEDITSEDNLLKLKDRSALNGMGYVILRKNKTFAEQVTKSNTIYEIRYDFDLNGEEITILDNCSLNFTGGSINNGSIICNNTSFLGCQL